MVGLIDLVGSDIRQLPCQTWNMNAIDEKVWGAGFRKLLKRASFYDLVARRSFISYAPTKTIAAVQLLADDLHFESTQHSNIFHKQLALVLWDDSKHKLSNTPETGELHGIVHTLVNYQTPNDLVTSGDIRGSKKKI